MERNADGLTQQPVVMEYVICQFIDRVSDEIVEQAPKLFISHALTKAQAKDYLRETQINLILRPIADQLINRLGSAHQIAAALQTAFERAAGAARPSRWATPGATA